MRTAHPEGTTLVGRATDAFERFRAGDRDALDELVEIATPLVWRTVREAGLDVTASEDVVQTVWLALVRHAESVKEPRAVVKWLLTTARREAWRAAAQVRADTARRGSVRDDDLDQVRDLAQRREDLPEEVVFRDERRRSLWHHVQQLPPRCRRLLCVIALADRPDYATIADSLGMPVGSIGPTRGRCLAKLRDLLSGDALWEGHLT